MFYYIKKICKYLLYSMRIIKLLFNYNTEDIQISIIIKCTHIIYMWQYNHNIIYPTTGPLDVLCGLVPAEIFSDKKEMQSVCTCYVRTALSQGR